MQFLKYKCFFFCLFFFSERILPKRTSCFRIYSLHVRKALEGFSLAHRQIGFHGNSFSLMQFKLNFAKQEPRADTLTPFNKSQSLRCNEEDNNNRITIEAACQVLAPVSDAPDGLQRRHICIDVKICLIQNPVLCFVKY